MKTVLITGAAGNLGGLLADYLKNTDLSLHLMQQQNNGDTINQYE